MSCKSESRDGQDMANPLRPILADEYVRYVGDYIAFVIAETKETARVAIEQIEIDFDILNQLQTLLMLPK